LHRSTGIDWPNDTSRSSRDRRHSLQAAPAPVFSKIARRSAISIALAAIEAGRIGRVAVQLDDLLGRDAEAWCSPSIFCVMTAAILPRRTSASTARGRDLGSAALKVSSMTKRRRQVSRRASSEARNSSK